MNTAISLQWCQTEFIDCWQSAFCLKIHRFLIPATAFARAMARNVLLQNAEIRAADSQLD